MMQCQIVRHANPTKTSIRQQRCIRISIPLFEEFRNLKGEHTWREWKGVIMWREEYGRDVRENEITESVIGRNHPFWLHTWGTFHPPIGFVSTLDHGAQ